MMTMTSLRMLVVMMTATMRIQYIMTVAPKPMMVSLMIPIMTTMRR